MKISLRSLIGFSTALLLSFPGLSPAHADPTPVTLGNHNCDFSAVGQGHGSASDPFLIGAPIDLQELNDCQDRQKSISNAVVNSDGTVTFTVNSVHGSFGVGQVVTIANTDDALLNVANAKVVSATDTTVTVKMAATLGSTTTGGTITAEYTNVKLSGDIDLGAASTESWNNTSTASITAATNNLDGTVTFTGNNNFHEGDSVFVEGMGDGAYNLGTALVSAATATEFTTQTRYSIPDGSATSAGGKAHAEGWLPVGLSRTEFDGANHTITGLKIYRHASYQGLFGESSSSQIKNLSITHSTVNTTTFDPDSGISSTGILAGRLETVILNNISIASSTVVSGGDKAGLVAGQLSNSSANSINVDGLVTVGLTASNTNTGIYWRYFGGVAGYSEDLTVTNVTSSATVDAASFSQDQEGMALTIPNVAHYYDNVGGVMGYSYNFTGRNIVASGSIRGRAYVGGAFGDEDYNGEIVNSSASGNVIATAVDSENSPVSYIGGFAGRLMGDSDNNNLSATGDVTVTVPAGSSSEAYRIGGLTGYANCCGASTGLSSTGTVTVNMLGSGQVWSVGGLMGENDCCQVVSHSTSTSNVNVHTVSSIAYGIGGFVGQWECCGADRQNSSSGDVTVTIDSPTDAWAYDIGGYAGYVDGFGTMNNLETSGNVSVTKGYKIGGFAGSMQKDMALRDIKVTGNVTDTYTTPNELEYTPRGNANVGGFIGWQQGRTAIERVSVTSNVSVTGVNDSVPRNVGGIIGGFSSNNGTAEILKSFYKGTVAGGNYVGGLIGFGGRDTIYRLEGNLIVASVSASATNAVVDPVMNSYFVDTSGTNFYDSTVAGSSVNAPNFNAATTAELKLDSTYVAKGWAFTGNSPWRIDSTTNSGYPYLTIPGNDDSRTSSGSNSETIVERVVDRIVERTVTKRLVYKTIKSVTFVKKATDLTKAQKQRLTAAAKVIAKSKYKSFIVSASPSLANISITANRASKVQAYLSSVLKKLKSHKVVSISITPKSSSASKAIFVKQGK